MILDFYFLYLYHETDEIQTQKFHARISHSASGCRDTKTDSLIDWERMNDWDKRQHVSVTIARCRGRRITVLNYQRGYWFLADLKTFLYYEQRVRDIFDFYVVRNHTRLWNIFRSKQYESNILIQRISVQGNCKKRM